MSDDQLRDYYAKQPKTHCDSDYEEEAVFSSDDSGDAITRGHRAEPYMPAARGVAVGPVAAEDEHARDLLEALNQAPLASGATPATHAVSVRLTANFVDDDDEVVRRSIIAAQLSGLYDDDSPPLQVTVCD